MAGPFRLSTVAFLIVTAFALSEAGHRKKKHHHGHGHHHRKHRRHKAPVANLTNRTNTTASNRSVVAVAVNASNGSAGGLLDVSNPKASHGAAAVHAAVHAALHRMGGHAARMTAHDSDLEKRKAEDWQALDQPPAKNLSLLNRSHKANKSTVALAHTSARVNASSTGSAKHPHAHTSARHRRPTAADTGEEAAAPAAHKEAATPQEGPPQEGELLVGGPLPPDFEERFAQGVSQAAHIPAEDVRVISVRPEESTEGGDVDTVVFAAPGGATQLVEDEAGDPNSDLAKGLLHIFLVDRSAEAAAGAQAAEGEQASEGAQAAGSESEAETESEGEADSEQRGGSQEEPPPAGESGAFDVDSEMPYGDLEPFGREDTAEELTGSSIRESDQMVDQLERAEVAEEKRAVFRALTRLRGAAITSFDGIARAQTGNIDTYNKHHRWRDAHPLHHLADEESDVNKWAFPDGPDC